MNRSHHRVTTSATLTMLLCGLAMAGLLVVSAATVEAAHDWSAVASNGSTWAVEDVARVGIEALRHSPREDVRRSAFIADRLMSPFVYDPRADETVARWTLPEADRAADPAASTDEYRIAFLGTGLGGLLGQAALGADPTLTNPSPADGSTAATGPAGTTRDVTFQVDYTDGDGDAPTTYEVEIATGSDGSNPVTGSPFTMNTTGSNWSAGETFDYTVALDTGDTYYFRFHFDNAADSDVYLPAAGYYSTTVASTPVLSSPQAVVPADIEHPTLVTFRCTYTDTDGVHSGGAYGADEPVAKVYIYTNSDRTGDYDESTQSLPPPYDGPPYDTRTSPYTMSLVSGSITSGAVFEVDVALARPDVYYYYFEFDPDGPGGDPTVETPLATATPPTQGPVVISRAPELDYPAAPYDDGADPDDGDGDPTTVTFRIIYTDYDGEAPSQKELHIFTDSGLTVPFGTSPYDMTKIAGDVGTGATYSVTVELDSPGHYYYYFVFDNGTYLPGAGPGRALRQPAAGSSPDYEEIILVNQAPTLSDFSLDPTSGSQWDSDDGTAGDQPYTFTVVYTDKDNEAPAGDGVLLHVHTTTSGASPTDYEFQMALDTDITSDIDDALFDGDYTNGEQYYVQVFGVNQANPGVREIGDGEHEFWFTANDGSEEARLPKTSGAYVGPTLNDPPNAVTSGFDPSGETLASTQSQPDITWNAASDPNSTDTAGVLSYRVEFSQSNAPFTPVTTYEGTATAGATTAQPGAPLPAGTWYYRIITLDDNSPEPAESGPSAVQQIDINAKPELSDGAVDPLGPDEDWLGAGEADTFEFSVVYTDANDDPPTEINTVVQNASTTTFPMVAPGGGGELGDGDYTNGELYVADLDGVLPVNEPTGADIGDGDHTFYFTANDGTEDADNHPTPAADGPEVNDAPNAVTSGFDPATGSTVHPTPDEISWDATSDPNSTDPPNTISYRVELSRWSGDWDSPEYTYDAAAGTTTVTVTETLATAKWYYRVVAIDDSGAETPSAVQDFTIEEAAPVLTLLADPYDDGVDPDSGGEGDTFTFRVNYSDPDGDPPSSPDLIITNTTTATTTTYPMSPLSFNGAPDYVTGEDYEVQVTGADIGDGEHEFYFEASDGVNVVQKYGDDPTETPFDGPLVNDPPNAPTTGFDPSGGDILTDRRPTISWDAATDPNSSDTAATLSYRVEFSQATPFVVDSDYTVTTTPGTTTADVPQPMANGVWYYRVTTIDDSGAESTPSAEQQFEVQGQQEPTLTNASVAPTSGGEADTFTFEVTYTDANDEAPTNDEVTLYVTNTTTGGAAVQFAMGEQTTPPYDYTAGVVYTVDVPAVLIGDGEHTHYFEASDGTTTVTQPVGGGAAQNDGPTVNDPPNPPDSGFDPARGTVVNERQPTVVWDEADDPNATDTPDTLSYRLEFSLTDTPFTVESDYTATTAAGTTQAQPAAELPNGTWYYRVTTIDDLGAESAPSAVQEFEVDVNNPPELSNPDVHPASAGLADTYTFEVTYTDADDDAPAQIQVTVTNTETSDVITRNMSQRDAGPYDYTAGVVFTVDISGSVLVDGEHTHYFGASDGTDATQLYQVDPDVEFDGPLVNDPPLAPDSGFDPTGGALVHSRQPTCTWDPGTDPNPTDPEDTLQYRLEFSQTAAPFTVEAAYTTLTAVGTTTAQPATPLPATAQPWYWRVWTIDNSGAESGDASAVQMFELDTNNAPEAPQPVEGYLPADGDTVRSVTPLFQWPEGSDQDPTDTPATLRYDIQVDDSDTFGSPLIDDQTAAGVTQYQVAAADALQLDAQYYWRVRTVDAQDAVSDWTEVALGLATPLGFTTRMVSVLQNAGLTPFAGALNTVFTFSVEYADADDLPPAGPIEVVIGPGDILIEELTRDLTDPDPWNVGVTYRTTVVGNELGLGHYDHYFRINTGDSHFDVQTPVYDGPVVGIDGQIRLTDDAWNDVNGYEENDTVYIEVDDGDENTDPGAVETIQVQVQDETGSDRETVDLVETGADTGLFRGQIDTIGRAGSNGDGELNVMSGPTGNTISASWTDPDGGAPAIDTALVTDTVAPVAVRGAQITAQSGPDGVTADVNWSPYDATAQIDAAGYHVWRSTTDFSDTAAATLAATIGNPMTQSRTIAGLTPNTTYFFAVTCFDEVPNEETVVETTRVTTADNQAPYLANEAPAPDAVEVPLDSDVAFDVLDDGGGVDPATFVVEVEGTDVTGDATITPVTLGLHVSYDPPADFSYNQQVDVHVTASDNDGNAMDETYSFTTVADVQPPQVANWSFDPAGSLTFDLTDDVSGVNMTSFVLQVDGVAVDNADPALTWDDSDLLDVSVDYTPADGWAYSTTLNFSVDVSDFAGNAMPTYTAQEDTEVDDTAPAADQLTPADGATDVAVDTAISLRLRDSQSGVDADSVSMDFDGQDVTADLDFGLGAAQAGGEAQVIVTYQPPDDLNYETDYDVHVEAADMVGNQTTVDWSFTTEAEQTFEIAGTITDSNGDPMPGVEVAADSVIVSTDGNGVYRLQGLTAGDYTVTPTLAEYDFEPLSEDVTVGPSARDVDFVGTARTYEIRGTVTDSAGDGVGGVSVTDGTRTTTTDADGNYAIQDVPNGNYTVSCSRDANADGFEDFNYTPRSRAVAVESADVDDVDFTATRRTYTISGTISDSRGNRISGVTVSDGTRTAITNEAGRFTIAGVPASTVTLTPTRTGMAFDPLTMDVTVPPDSTGNDFAAFNEFTRRFGAGLRMVAVPCLPPAGRDRAVDVFGTESVARWNASATPPGYVAGDTDPDHLELEVRPGAAFFVKFANDTTVTVPGDPVDGDGTFSVGVYTGWNQLGNMYQQALPLANISAAGSTQIRPFGFIWDPDVGTVGGYRMISRDPAFNAARNFIEAWEGAWFRVTGAAGTLTITAPAGVTSQSLVEGAAASLEAPADGWLVPIVARAAGAADVTTLAGVASGDAAQGLRVENPPMVPGTVDVYFTDGDARLAHDIRPQTSSQMVWPFTVETDLADAQVELTLPDLSGVPADLAVYLSDLDAGKRIYARTLPSYTFTAGAGGAARHFELEVAPRGADNLSIASASVQATGAGLVVTYDVSTSCAVSVEVLNIAGRKIRQLMQSQAAEPGRAEQVWDLRSADGTIVPNGTYLIKIEAVAENGQRVQALRPAQIER